MKNNTGTLDVKLRELERQYYETMERLHRCRQAEHDQVRRSLKEIWQEYREQEMETQRSIARCHSPAVGALSAAQTEYDLKIQHILREKLPGYLHSAGTDAQADEAEAAGLYAEYAIDFAAQALRHALLAALSVADLEMELEERANQTETEE